MPKPAHTPRHWLLAYDIANPRRLQRLHYRLRKRALFVQQSVAVLRTSETELRALLAQLEQHFDRGTDDLRVYRVDWPDGAWLTGPKARDQLLMTTAPDPTPQPRRPAGRPRKSGLIARMHRWTGA